MSKTKTPNVRKQTDDMFKKHMHCVYCRKPIGHHVDIVVGLNNGGPFCDMMCYIEEMLLLSGYQDSDEYFEDILGQEQP